MLNLSADLMKLAKASFVSCSRRNAFFINGITT
jgi:hypothetical protein